MKKVSIFITFIVISIVVAFGQTDSPTFNSFISDISKVESKYREHYDKREYKQTEIFLQEMLKLAENLKLTPDETAKFQPIAQRIKAEVYYNLACTYSLLNQKKQAIAAFGKALDLGYSEYRHAKTDSDLDNIRKEKKFTTLLDRIKQFDKLVILQNAQGYQKDTRDSLPQFSYQSAEDSNLKEVKNFFKLDSVAGSGDELSKIINILNFVHNAIKHNGGNYALCEFDAIDIYNYHKSTGKGVNCRHLAIALNEMYLSMGIPSRYVTCLPKDENDQDCHVINSVYSSQLQKWLWIDPTFNAYIKDEDGNLLSIAEVRERLIASKPLVLNDDANWNNQSKQTKEDYLDTYMAKNLYWFECVDYNRFNPESRYRKIDNQYIALKPIGFRDNATGKTKSSTIVTHDAEYFWQAPQKKD